MIDNIGNYLSKFPQDAHYNRLREYLQWLMLKALDEQGLRKQIAFVGGTALRIIYQINRFSEDLDFSLIEPGPFDIATIAKALEKAMRRLGLEPKISRLKNQQEKSVASFFMQFNDLLYPLGISPNKNQPLSIKFEVDANPPAGAGITDYFFADPIMFWITHHDLPSLFSGKLSAFLFRDYDKGRDFYDLIFFLKKRSPINLTMFQNAARQARMKKPYASQKHIFDDVLAKLEKVDMSKIKNDMQPFFLDPSEEKYLSKEAILNLLNQQGF